MTVKERFLRYVVIDSGSSETSAATPSTPKQWDMARLLERELNQLGAANVWLSDQCCLYAELPANAERQPAIGLIAHIDTAPAVATGPVRPQCVVYQGGDIAVGHGAVMKAADYQSLSRHIGHELILTDGTTLLGGDDKAGVAEIVTACETLLAHPEIKHGKLYIAFTPDEEIGAGADHFDLKRFQADYAYTVDGGGAGEYECENFNAASATLAVRGFNIHPGSAKDKMKNAAKIAMAFAALLPEAESPEHTEGREGFYHLTHMQGDESEAVLHYILRDHSRAAFEAKKTYLQACAQLINARYGEGTAVLTLKDTYYNMKEIIDRRPEITRRALEAIRFAGDEPKILPIRGGTDGARLSYMGLPCPNLPTGVYNMHGVLEYVSIPEMERCVKMLVKLCEAVL